METDRRREAGEKTRQRILDTALALLAERGVDAVTLRDVTEAAGVNVAAVKYHFGSKPELFRVALTHALERQIEALTSELRVLGDSPTLDAIARAMARPVIAALGPHHEGYAVLRLVARAAANRTQAPDPRVMERTERAASELLSALRRALPGVPDEELRFRSECMGGILSWLMVGPMLSPMEGKTEAEIEALVIPVLVGVLAGGDASAAAR